MIDQLLQTFIDGFHRVQEAIFESVVQPVVFALGFGNLLEDGYNATLCDAEV